MTYSTLVRRVDINPECNAFRIEVSVTRGGWMGMRAVYGTASTEQMLGALPVVAGFCHRLDIAGIIDRAAPVREVARVSHGQVIQALVANRLTSPTPMIHVQGWAQRFAVEAVLGVAADALNDDRIARALDALADVLDEVTGSVGAAAIGAFGIDVSQLHWDMTSISLFGEYRNVDVNYPMPRFGHPKDRRTDLKQIQAGVASAADGAVPVFFKPYDGGAGEVSQVVAAMEALRRLAGPRMFLLVGDSKLLSYTNIAAMIESKVTFLAPASKVFVPAEVLARCDYHAAVPVEFVAQRDLRLPPDQRGHYRVIEDTQTVTGPSKTKSPTYTLRRVFVHSSARADAARRARDKKLDRARGDLHRLVRGLGSRHYNTGEKVTARVHSIAEKRRVGDYLRTTIGIDHNARPTLEWSFDPAALTAEAATDGWYALLTNLPDTVTASQALTRYKNQPSASERRYHDFKGPLAVAPMFLHTNRRMAALIGVICLALLIYCLIEREARRNLAPAVTLDGIYPGRAARPTTSLILASLSSLRLRTGADGQPEIPQPDPVQTRVLDILKIDPRHLA
jgi:transposase